MKNVLKVILFTFIFWSINALASDNGWNYSIGLSVKQMSLDVYEKGKTDPEGTLTEDYIVTPEIGLESNITYFSDSSWGYKYAINFGLFEMTTQEVDLKDVNLNTSVNGYYLYAMPVGVYDFLKDKENSSLLVGFGLGLGYLNASGDIIFTESSPQTKHDFDFSELTYSYGLFFAYEIYSWSYSISLYGPEVSDGNYEYNLFDFGLTVRKKFTFQLINSFILENICNDLTKRSTTVTAAITRGFHWTVFSFVPHYKTAG